MGSINDTNSPQYTAVILQVFAGCTHLRTIKHKLTESVLCDTEFYYAHCAMKKKKRTLKLQCPVHQNLYKLNRKS